MSKIATKPASVQRLAYSVAEAAEALGVSAQTVAREIARRRLRASYVGRRVVIRAADIEKMLDAQAVQS